MWYGHSHIDYANVVWYGMDINVTQIIVESHHFINVQHMAWLIRFMSLETNDIIQLTWLWLNSIHTVALLIFSKVVYWRTLPTKVVYGVSILSSKSEIICSTIVSVVGYSVSCCTRLYFNDTFPYSKVHEANLGPTWVLSAPDGPHVCPINLAIRVTILTQNWCSPLIHMVSHKWHKCSPLIDSHKTFEFLNNSVS